MATATALPKRQDVPREFTWNLESIYPDNERWEADFSRVEAMLPELSALAGTLGEGADALLTAIQRIHEAELVLEQLLVYALMRKDEDTANAFYQALAERGQGLAARFGSATAFFNPELLALPDERIDEFVRAEEELRVYGHFFDELRRQRAHIRSVEVEEVLAEARDVLRSPGTIFGMLNDADLKYPTIRDEQGHEVELTKGRYQLFLESKDRRVRKDALEGLYSSYDKVRNTTAASLSGSIRRDWFEAKVRGYSSSLQAALEPHAIPVEVYHNLVDTVNQNLHHLHRYWRLRKEYLGLDALHLYDVYVPLVPGATVEFEYDEARRLVEQGLSPLGPDYVSIMRDGLHNQRWVDVFENEGKRSGAYSFGAYTTQPFILMNYQKNLNNVYTLAHELGHSMHSFFTRRTQPYVYGSYTLFVAEVAPTLNEALLSDYLLKHTDDRALRLQVINQQIDEFRGTLFRQTMFAEFELETHKRVEAGEALTPDTFGEIYRGLLERYFGPDVVLDEQILLEWSRIPRFYRNLYVYQYATGISAATALSHKILQEGQPAVERYLNFLRGGSSKTSVELLRDAGVDMTTPEPVQQAAEVFGGLVTQLEGIVREEKN